MVFLMSWCPPFPSMPLAGSYGLSLRILGRHSLIIRPSFRTQKPPCSVFPLLSLILVAITPWFTSRRYRTLLDIIQELATYSQRWFLHISNHQVLPVHRPAPPSHGQPPQRSGSLMLSSVEQHYMLLVSPMQNWTITPTTNWTRTTRVDRQGARRHAS